MISAVQLHRIRVSMNTLSDCTMPCATGCLTSATAATLGALPSPASLENSPRLTPIRMAAPMPPANAGKCRLQAKGTVEDQREGLRNGIKAADDDEQGHAQVGQRHQRDQYVRPFGDAANAAEDDQTDHGGQRQAAGQGRYA